MTEQMDAHASVNMGYGKKVLVVEDEELAQAVAKHYLERLGCDVDFAATGADALRLVSANHYNLIFMDIGIFDMDGFNIAKKIRNMNNELSKTPIVALTIHVYESLKKSAEELGFIDYISKPLTLEDCKRVLTKIGC